MKRTPLPQSRTIPREILIPAAAVFIALALAACGSSGGSTTSTWYNKGVTFGNAWDKQQQGISMDEAGAVLVCTGVLDGQDSATAFQNLGIAENTPGTDPDTGSAAQWVQGCASVFVNAS